MDFINLINNKNPIIELKQELTNTGVSNLLYGAGVAAEYIYDYLTGNGIKVDIIAIDKEYYSSLKTTNLREKEIHCIEEISNKVSSINLIIGFHLNNIPLIAKRKAEMLTRQGLRINKVYIFDSSLFICPEDRIISYDFVLKNIKKFKWLYKILFDKKSKDTLVSFLNQRISMQIGYLDKVLDKNQYFPSSIVKFGKDEVYIDCGAYDGDTVQKFIEAIKAWSGSSYQMIYALEPDYCNYKDLIECCNHLDNVFAINKGAWSKEGSLKFQGNKKTGSMITDLGEDTIKVTTIDRLLYGSKATFIKMDIQGAEYEALKGAKETIRKYMPILAICVYHKKHDLLTIPEYLNSISNYDFYLRAYSNTSNELVLYCVKHIN